MKIRSVQDLKGRQEREKQNPFFAAPDRNRPSKTDRTASFCESATRFVASECANGLELFSLGEFHNQSKVIQPLFFRGVASQVYGFHLPPDLDDRSMCHLSQTPWSLPSYTKHCCGPNPFKLLTYTTCCMLLLHFFFSFFF